MGDLYVTNDSGELIEPLAAAYSEGMRFSAKGYANDVVSFGVTEQAAIESAISTAGSEADRKGVAELLADDGADSIAAEIAHCLSGSLPISPRQRVLLRAIGTALLEATK